MSESHLSNTTLNFFQGLENTLSALIHKPSLNSGNSDQTVNYFQILELTLRTLSLHHLLVEINLLKEIPLPSQFNISTSQTENTLSSDPPNFLTSPPVRAQ